MIRELIRSVSGYPGLFFLCVGSGTLVPLPEDFALLYAGMGIREGRQMWWAVLPVAILGVGLRDLMAFFAGRWLGDWLMARSWGRRLLGGDKRIAWMRSLVETRGDRAILLGRFAVGFRAPIFFVGGAMGLSARRFLAWDGLGLLIAIPLTVLLGHAFGQPLVDGVYWTLQRVRVVLVVAAIALLIVGWYRGWLKDLTGPSEA